MRGFVVEPEAGSSVIPEASGRSSREADPGGSPATASLWRRAGRFAGCPPLPAALLHSLRRPLQEMGAEAVGRRWKVRPPWVTDVPQFRPLPSLSAG